MSALPMQEEGSGQELYTRDHGTVKVDKKSWIDGGFHIVLCGPNGPYMHANGLPVKDEKELRAAFGSNKEDLDKALNWFRNRHDDEASPPREIKFNRVDGHPMFDDGTVPTEADLFNFFSPGPILAAAIVALNDYKKGGQAAAPQSKKVQEAVESIQGTVPKPPPPPPKPRPKNTKGKRAKSAPATG